MFHAKQLAGEVLDYAIDYTNVLDGATAISSTWTITPATGATLIDAGLAAGVTTFLLSSDQTGELFIVENTLTTATDTFKERIEFYISP